MTLINGKSSRLFPGKIRRVPRPLLLTVLLCITASSYCLAEPALLLGTFAGPPMSTAESTGFYDRLLLEAFGRADRQVEIIQLPAERSLINADQGITDGDFVRIGGLHSLYPNLIQVPEKITDFEFVAFSRHVHIPIAGWDSLRPYEVAIVRGWKILQKNIVGAASLVQTKNQRLLFTLLDKDRVDIVVYSRFEGYWVLRQLNIQGVKTLEPPLAVREMYLYLNKKHRQLVPVINRYLRQMKEDGTYARIKDETLAPFYPETRD